MGRDFGTTILRAIPRRRFPICDSQGDSDKTSRPWLWRHCGDGAVGRANCEGNPAEVWEIASADSCTENGKRPPRRRRNQSARGRGRETGQKWSGNRCPIFSRFVARYRALNSLMGAKIGTWSTTSKS